MNRGNGPLGVTLTDAILFIEIITLFSIGIMFSRSHQDWKLAFTRGA